MVETQDGRRLGESFSFRNTSILIWLNLFWGVHVRFLLTEIHAFCLLGICFATHSDVFSPVKTRMLHLDQPQTQC